MRGKAAGILKIKRTRRTLGTEGSNPLFIAANFFLLVRISMTPDNLNTRLHNQDTASALSILWSCSEQWTLCVFVCFFFFFFFFHLLFTFCSPWCFSEDDYTNARPVHTQKHKERSVHADMLRKMMLLQAIWMMIIFNDDQILLKPTIAIDPLSIIKHDWYACSEQAADTDRVQQPPLLEIDTTTTSLCKLQSWSSPCSLCSPFDSYLLCLLLLPSLYLGCSLEWVHNIRSIFLIFM